MALGLVFSEPKKVRTKYGEKYLQKASPTSDFWDEWRRNKDKLREQGYSVSKDKRSGRWEVCFWNDLSEEEKKKKAEDIASSRASSSDIDIPSPANLDYLPYQKAGIQYALSHPRCIIGDAMGLGKTIQAIGVINSTDVSSVLVIVPASLKINWQREIEKWRTRSLSVGIASTKELPDTDIVIVPYSMFSRNNEVSDKISMRKWDLVILDEAHYCKNSKAKRTQRIMGAGKGAGIQADRKLLLTGTPITNRPIELFSLLHYLDDREWSSFWAYAKRYCNAHHNGYGWDLTGASRLGELQERLRSTVMVRRLKEDVLTELPPKRRQIIDIPRNGHSDLIQEEAKEWGAVEDELSSIRDYVELMRENGTKDEYEQAVHKLRDASKMAFESLSRIRHKTAVAKVPYVVDHLMSIIESTGEPVVVFAHHKDVIAKIRSALSENDITSVQLTGSDNTDDRQKAVDDFQSGKAQVFVGSISAAGVGITLTASSHVIFAELDWVPGNISQAEDRLHRIGQRNSVLVQHIVFDESIDSRIAKMIVEKQRIIDKSLDNQEEMEKIKDIPAIPKPKSDGGSNSSPDFSREQIGAILSGLKEIAGMDLDRAQEKNDVGFSKTDTDIGHSLASQDSLTDKQAVIGLRLVKKYWRQLPSDMVDKAKG